MALIARPKREPSMRAKVEIDDRRHADVEIVAVHRVSQHEAEQRRARDADEAVRTSGQPLLVLDEQINDDGETQRGDGEVRARQPRDRHHQQAGEGRGEPGAEQSERKRQAELVVSSADV